jgi:hypothetical protein
MSLAHDDASPCYRGGIVAPGAGESAVDLNELVKIR